MSDPGTVGQARLAPMLATALAVSAFKELGVGATVWLPDDHPRVVHLLESSFADFEAEHGRQVERWEYNARSVAEVRQTRRLVVGEHIGVHDLWVPIDADGASILAVGSFHLRRPTGRDLTERWAALALRHANLADPGFTRFIATSLATPLLEGPLLQELREFADCFAGILGHRGDATELSVRLDASRERLLRARGVERMWEAARTMLDTRTEHTWAASSKRGALQRLEMARPPQHVAVVLLRKQLRAPESLDEVLARDVFQRAVAELALRVPNVVSGQVGHHGVSLLSCVTGSRSRLRTSLTALVGQVSELARRAGFGCHAGIALGLGVDPLSACYRAALAAADRALCEQASFAVADDRGGPSPRSLIDVRAALAESLQGAPDTLRIRFERFVEAALVRTGYQLDAARAHLEAGLERLAEPLLSSGQLDRRSFEQLCAPLQQEGDGSVTVTSLVEAYRGAVAEIEHAVRSPTEARRSRSLLRAVTFMREHCTEPLTLARVARVAGYAPSHFGKLLKREERMSFEPLLMQMRLESAKSMLTSSALPVSRVAQLAGFKGRTHFQQRFRRTTGETPLRYRRRTRMAQKAPSP